MLQPKTALWTLKLGKKNYELTNYLGNVNAVITDRKVLDPTNPVFKAVVVATTDYYAFGMAMPGRQTGSGAYRFGYNGMEIDKEMSGNGNSYTTEFRQYDPRLGRWKSLDPLMAQFPWQSPYCGMDNNPVFYNDPLGLSTEDWIKREGSTKWEYDSGVQTEVQAKSLYGEKTQYMDDGGTYEGMLNGESIGTVTLHHGGLQTWNGGSYQSKDINPIQINSNFGTDFFKSYFNMQSSNNSYFNNNNSSLFSPLQFKNPWNKSEYNKSSKDNKSSDAQSSGGDWANALGVGLGVGELARQGKVYQIYGRSAENVENALKNGQYIHTNGKTYSQGFRGNQYISSKSVSNSLSTAKVARNLGRGMTGVGLALSGYQLLNSQGTGSDYARFTGSLIITGTAAIPIVGPFISIGLGFADSFGAFDPIYNYFGK